MSGFISNFYAGTNPLYKGNPAFTGVRFYDDAVRGTNLIAKAAQLVNDLEAARNVPSFQTLFKESAKTFEKPFISGEDYFANLVKDVRATLEKDNKPLTVLNFIEAQRSLSETPAKDIDVKA